MIIKNHVFKNIFIIFLMCFTVLNYFSCTNWKENKSDAIAPDLDIEKEPLTWVKLNMPANMTALYPYRSSFVLTGDIDGNIFISKDNCNSWNKTKIVEKKSAGIKSFVCFFDKSMFNNVLAVAASEQGIYYSEDNCASWALCSDISATADKNEVNTIAINYLSPMNTEIDVYGYFGSDGNCCYNSSLIRGAFLQSIMNWHKTIISGADYKVKSYFQSSINNSYNYTVLTKDDSSGMVVTLVGSRNTCYFSNDKTPICIVADKKNIIYVGAKNGLYYSNDDGLGYKLLSFSNKMIKSLCINSSDVIFVSTSDGIYSSKDNGSRWNDISPFANNCTGNLMIGSDDWLYLITDQNDCYRIYTSILETSLTPILIYPKSNTTGVDNKLILQWDKWKSQQSAFVLQVSTDSTFTNSFVVNERWIKSDYYNLNNLSANTKYYWRVGNINPVFRSSWSEVWSFTTK
jgi:hypothetical protein